MKSRKIFIILAVLLGTLITLPIALQAGGAGSSDDPLVTYSYINGTFKTALAEEIKKQLGEDFAKQIKEDILKELGQSGTASSADFTVEHLTAGQSLRAEGPCELILRSGEAAVFVESEENISAGVGLSDCTDGGEVLNGQAVPRRHLLIIPRGDGRGVTVSAGEAYFMARGDYKITG